METMEETRSPEHIERDIERTRSQMAGTLDDIQRSFSPGQLVDQALGYIEEKSGNLGASVANAVRDNPVPVTLIGVGLAWLATAGWNESRRGGGEEYRYSRSQPPGRGRHSAGVRYGSRSQQAMGGRYGGEMSGPGQGGSWEGQGQRMGEALGETMGQVKGAVGEAAETVRQKASETAEQVRETYGQMRERATEMTDEARQRALEMGHRVQDRAERVVRDEPLVVGAVGLAIGAALGAWMPRTRPEDRLMGGARDELLQAADQTGGDMLREVREQVAAGMESAKSQSGEPAPMAGMPPAGHAEPGQAQPVGSPGEAAGGHTADPGWAHAGGEPSKKPEHTG